MDNVFLWVVMNVFYGWLIFGNGSKVVESFEGLPILSFLTANRKEDVVRRAAIVACVWCNLMLFRTVLSNNEHASTPLYRDYFSIFWSVLERLV